METLKLSSDPEIIDLSEYKDAAELPASPDPSERGEKSPIVEMGIPIEKPVPEFQQAKTPETDQENWKNNPDYFQSGPKQGQKRQRKPRTTMAYTGKYEESEISADVITGAMFLSVVDLLIPMLFITINNYITGENLKPGDMALSTEQLKKLETVADRAMSYIKLRGNPLIILGLTMLGLYSMTLVKAKMMYKVKMMNEKTEPKK